MSIVFEGDERSSRIVCPDIERHGLVERRRLDQKISAVSVVNRDVPEFKPVDGRTVRIGDFPDGRGVSGCNACIDIDPRLSGHFRQFRIGHDNRLTRPRRGTGEIRENNEEDRSETQSETEHPAMAA
jgi:hypothetical protein